MSTISVLRGLSPERHHCTTKPGDWDVSSYELGRSIFSVLERYKRVESFCSWITSKTVFVCSLCVSSVTFPDKIVSKAMIFYLGRSLPLKNIFK